MKRRTWSRSIVAALLVTLLGGFGCGHSRATAASTPAATQAPDGKIRLTIVGTNDVHGWIEPHEPPKGERESLVGGFDVFASYLKVLREQRPDSVILLDGGDLFQGTLVANQTEGAAVIRAFNAIGYDATTIGNHEFDYGPEGQPVTAVTPSEDPVGNLKERIQEARFPMLTGNIFDRSTGAPVEWKNAPRTTIVRRQGISIGIIGLTTPSTPSVTLVQNVKGLEFKPLVPTTIELAKKLRNEGADVVVVAMHAGAGCPLGSAADDLSKCEGSELFPYLDALPEGTIDAVVAGHTHQYLAHFVKGVPVIQSKSYADAFGVIELTYDAKETRLDKSATTIWKPTALCRKVYVSTKSCTEGSGPLTEPEFLGKKITPDEATAQAMQPDIQRIAQLKSEKLGPVLSEPFTRNRAAESSLGDLVSDVMREQIAGADVAVFNSGGLRADLAAGPLTYGRVFSALPFDNRFAVLKLTGAELSALIAKGLSGDHGILQVSGVLIEAIAPGAKPCGPNKTRLLKLKLSDGRVVDPKTEYTVVTNDFVSGGGDGYDAILKHVDPLKNMVRHDLPPVREVVVTHFRLHPELVGPSHNATGRIRFVKPTCNEGSVSR